MNKQNPPVQAVLDRLCGEVPSHYLDDIPKTVKPPWPHQRIAYWWIMERSYSLISMMMGGGKTKVAIDAIRNSGAERTLVLTPKAAVAAWRGQSIVHGGDLDFIMPEGTVAMKCEAVHQALTERVNGHGCQQVFVLGYHAAAREPLFTLLLNVPWDIVICDESHKIKSHNAMISKAAWRIGHSADKRIAMTGTVLSQSPLDIYGQARFCNDEIFGRSWCRFRDYHAIRANPYVPQQITGYMRLDELAMRMAGWVLHIPPEVVTQNLPPATHTTIPINLPPKTRAVYESMRASLCAEWHGHTLTAANALSKTLRLQQMTSGLFAKDRESPALFDTSKADVLLELLSGINEPVVVFGRFAGDLVQTEAAAKTLGRRYSELSGSRRDALTPEGRLTSSADVVGVMVQAGSLGVDLSAARYGVFFSVPWSVAEYQQAISRLHRPGQHRPVMYYHLVATDTIDEAIYKSFRTKRDVCQSVLEHIMQAGIVICGEG